MTLGIGHLHHGEPQAAEAAFSDVRTLIDTSRRSWLRPFEMTYSAAVLMQQGRLLEASMLCRQVIRPTGDEPIEIWAQTALYELGCIYLEWGLLDDARRALNRADERAEATQTLTWRSRIRVALARVMAAQLGEIGIEVEVRAFEFATFFADIKKGAYQIATMQTSDIGEPDYYLAYFHSSRIPTAAAPDCNNRWRYRNLKVDELSGEGRRVVAVAERGRV